MNLFDLGQALKEARIRQQLTQSELAGRTGISLSSISGLERGILSEIGVVKLLQLFSAVGIQLHTKPAGQRRTLDDARREQQQEVISPLIIQQASSQFAVARPNDSIATRLETNRRTQKQYTAKQRVRHSKKASAP
ncbi:helix-turn-helix domain-containing protein [Undibacterium sp. RuTC16W]|uniref:helix-turn-helix domain-containing protein n=1 Tax=Undibacterium sp. RuTC16W TaxID=3413048 RepID=UPI003BEFBACF